MILISALIFPLLIEPPIASFVGLFKPFYDIAPYP